jgi:hypothetical protein
MITATTGPVFVIASMGGDEAVPFGKVYSDWYRVSVMLSVHNELPLYLRMQTTYSTLEAEFEFLGFRPSVSSSLLQ